MSHMDYCFAQDRMINNLRNAGFIGFEEEMEMREELYNEMQWASYYDQLEEEMSEEMRDEE